MTVALAHMTVAVDNSIDSLAEQSLRGFGGTTHRQTRQIGNQLMVQVGNLGAAPSHVNSLEFLALSR